MPKKIIFLIPTLSMGGGERVVSELSLNLPSSIERIIVLFKNDIFYPYKGKLISLGMSFSNNFPLKIHYFLKGFFLFKKIVEEENPDYIITFGFPADLMGLLSSSSKTLIGAHSLWSKSHGGFIEKILIKLFFNKSKKIICVSKTVAEDLISNFGIKKEKIKIIFNPINVEKIKKSSILPIEPKYQKIFNNPVIITMGRLSGEKNHSSLIKAFKEIKNKVKTAKLIILGTGDNKEPLEQLIKELDLGDSVYLLGRQDNPFKFLAKAKVFVLSSLREGLPCSILEAMACGLPIISTDCKSGPREILAPGTDIKYQIKDIEYAEFGILTPIDSLTNSKKELAGAVIKVLTDKKLSDNLIEKSKQRAEDFNIKNIIKEWQFLENDKTT
ncbi:MAG: glycosyltransferase [Patescibacteria group bacterium]